MKTAVLLLAALVLAPAAAAVSVEPTRAAAGETVTIVGPPGDVELVPLDTAGPARPLGRVGADGTLSVAVPDVPHGRYRVVVGRAGEAPVLEVLPLSQDTSLLLVGFGFLLVIALGVAGVVVHRRWRDAIG
ncbi:MAG: hypothetical protein ACYC1P_09600 [Gaiellaceae bacterium]